MFRVMFSNLLFCVLGLSVCADTGAVLTDINTHRDSLKRLGLDSFTAECRASGWPLPWMPSKWRWANIGDESERQRVAASRALGLELLIEIDKRAAQARVKKTPEQDAEEAHFWFDLADWCAATRGYGNLMIARRCADIGNIPLSRLAINESVKINDIVSFEKQAKTPWDSIEERRHILNGEAEAEVFPVAKDQEKTLYDIWVKGAIMLFDQEDPGERQKAPIGFLREPSVTLMALPVQGLKFFRDEDSPSTATTIADWDIKRHKYVLNGGMQLNGFRPIQFLINYRKALGRFPQQPYKQSPFYKGLEGAFDEEWRAIASKHPDLPVQTGHAAFSAYDRITKGEFNDYDYQITHPRTAVIPK